MSALVWGAWATEWALDEKVSFNGSTKQITVNAGVSSLDIAADVYSAWVRWTARERGFLPAMRYSGYDAIPGGRTGATFFTINGWKLVYDPNVVAVSGVLYSTDYSTAYWSASGEPIYPATVAALVNSAVSYQNVVTGVAASPEEIWSYGARTLSDYSGVWQAPAAVALGSKVDIATAILKNKTTTNPNTGVMTIYADDGVTPLFTATLYETIDGSVQYRGKGAERREALT